MKLKNNIKITDLINAKMQYKLVNNGDELRKKAKKQVLKIQEKNSKTFNLRRRKANKSKINDL